MNHVFHTLCDPRETAGQSRDIRDRLPDGISQHMQINKNPDLPPELKPMRASRVGHVLRNPIYVGDLVWNRHCTGVVCGETPIRAMRRSWRRSAAISAVAPAT